MIGSNAIRSTFLDARFREVGVVSANLADLGLGIAMTIVRSFSKATWRES
jgi:hypothetical protein